MTQTAISESEWLNPKYTFIKLQRYMSLGEIMTAIYMFDKARQDLKIDEYVFSSQMDSYINNPFLYESRFWRDSLSNEERLQMLHPQMRSDSEVFTKNFISIFKNLTPLFFSSLLDSFFEDLFATIIYYHFAHASEALSNWEKWKKLKTFDEYIHQFNYSTGLDTKIRIFKKIGVDIDYAFQLNECTQEVKNKYKDVYQYIVRIYGQRNDFAHRQTRSDVTTEIAEEYSDFLSMLTVNIAMTVYKQFAIPTEYFAMTYFGRLDDCFLLVRN